MSVTPGHLRIGELGRRVGVSRELLRAWESRYALLEPVRSPGGFRLYSAADEERVRAMLRSLASGLSAAEAAKAVRARGEVRERPAPSGLPAARGALQSALEDFDDAGAHALVDGILATFAIDTVLAEVLLPVLRSLGDRWETGEVTVAQEHFASNVLRGRLLGLARGWGRGIGPLAVLACPPGEQHDMGLLMFGISMREAGWRVVFLGAETPVDTLVRSAESLGADVVVVSAVTPEPLVAAQGGLGELAGHTALAIGGAGADAALARSVGAVLLTGDPVAAATGLALSLAS